MHSRGVWHRCGCRSRCRQRTGQDAVSQLGCRGTVQGSPLPGPSLTSLGPGQVKRAVVQVISAMAHHGYLEQPGGEAMVEYIVRQCALPPKTEVRGCPPPVRSGAQKLSAFGRPCARQSLRSPSGGGGFQPVR